MSRRSSVIIWGNAGQPSMVVFDEMPYLAREDPGFEGTLQKSFDRTLSRLPVLLVLIGSDLAMMEALNTYGRPFYQRGTEMIVPPLNPVEVAAMLGLPAAEAIDAFLVTGGLPLILDEWPQGAALWEYLKSAVNRPTSALIVSGERALAAEFPAEAQARTVLGAIGHGERTFTLIGRAAGGLNPGALSRSLGILTSKRLVEAHLPLSTQPSKDTRYYVADTHLRFWLTFIGPSMPAIERGRGDQVLAAIKGKWSSWRGRAIEPIVRQSLLRLPAGMLPEGTEAVGGYWTRTNDPEIDLVGADAPPSPRRSPSSGPSSGWKTSPSTDATSPGLSSTAATFPAPTTPPRCWRYPAPAPPPAASPSSPPRTCSPHGNPLSRAKRRKYVTYLTYAT